MDTVLPIAYAMYSWFGISIVIFLAVLVYHFGEWMVKEVRQKLADRKLEKLEKES
jgi:hypothetical protein